MVTLKLISSKAKLEKLNPTCLIMGDGRCLQKDLDSFLINPPPHDVMSIAKSYKLYPGRILHWSMVDSNANVWWARHLPLRNNGDLPIRHTLGECEGFDVNWDDGQDDGALWHGTSALFATLVALNLGYEKIILAGCPMDNKGHWYFSEEQDQGPDWKEEDYQIWRDFVKTEEAKKVKSLSGYIAQIIGLGMKKWIKEQHIMDIR